MKGKPLPITSSGSEWATSKIAYVGRDIINPGITILPISNSNGLSESG